MNGFHKEAIKWRTHSPINYRHPIKSIKTAYTKLQGCDHIRIRIVRQNMSNKTGALVFQVEGYELPDGDF